MTTLAPAPTGTPRPPSSAASRPVLGWRVHDTLAMVDRSVRRELRAVDTLLLAVMLPIILMLMFVYVFGGAIQTDARYVDYVVPGILLLCTGYGAATTAVAVATDMTGGLMDRFRSLPTRPAAALTGHVAASVARNAVSTALVIGVAYLVGFRPTASPGDWVAVVGILLLYVLALTWVAVCLGLVASSAEAANGFSFAVLFLPYISSAFVPPSTMPPVLEWVATYQPITPVTDTLRGLFLGLPLGAEPWVALAWCVGFLLLARVWAVVLFRRRR